MLTKNKFPLLLLLFLSVTSVAVVSCEKDDEEEDIVYTLTGDANGNQEAPNKVTTPGTGTIAGTYNKNSRILQYTITWTGLTSNVNNMHFHGPAFPGVAAGVSKAITGWTATTAGSVSRSDTLTADQEAQMLGGKWYYNIHTVNNGGGEIRGQVFTMR